MVSAGTRASSDPARRFLTNLAPRSPGSAHGRSPYYAVASPAAGGGLPPADADPSASLEAAFRRGWEAAEAASPPPLPPPAGVGVYTGHRLSSAAAPFSPGLSGFGVDPSGFGAAARRGVQVSGSSCSHSHLP